MKRFCVALMIALCSCGLAAAQPSIFEPAEENLLWVTIGEDIFDQLAAGDLALSHQVRRIDSDSGVVITRLSPDDLDAVSKYIHAKTVRWGG